MSEAPSIRDSLKAAREELSAEAPAPAEGVTGAAGAAAAAPEPVEPEAPRPEGGPERDEHGRFKAKTDTPPAAEGAQAAAPPAEAKEPEPAKPAEPEPQPEATRVPPSLPAAVKAKFGSLDSDVQKAFVTLEESVQTAKAEWGRKGERLNRYDEIIGPRLARWQMNGLDEFSGIQTLLAAQDVLDANPVAGLVQIARSYGVTPAHLAQAFGLTQANGGSPGAEGQPAPTGAPDISAVLQQHLSPLAQQVQTLQKQLQERDQRTEAEKLADAQREVETFRAQPEHMYFDNVRDDVAVLLQSGRAKSLKDAYDQACWMNPEVRQLLLDAQSRTAQQAQAAQEAEARRKAEEQARSRAQQAAHAAGSVTGAPAPGAQPPSAPHATVREALLAAKQELGAAV